MVWESYLESYLQRCGRWRWQTVRAKVRKGGVWPIGSGFGPVWPIGMVRVRTTALSLWREGGACCVRDAPGGHRAQRGDGAPGAALHTAAEGSEWEDLHFNREPVARWPRERISAWHLDLGRGTGGTPGCELSSPALGSPRKTIPGGGRTSALRSWGLGSSPEGCPMGHRLTQPSLPEGGPRVGAAPPVADVPPKATAAPALPVPFMAAALPRLCFISDPLRALLGKYVVVTISHGLFQRRAALRVTVQSLSRRGSGPHAAGAQVYPAMLSPCLKPWHVGKSSLEGSRSWCV